MKTRVQIKGKETYIIKLLKGLNIDIYSIKYIKGKSIYIIDSTNISKIPKSILLYKDDTFKEKIIKNKNFLLSTLIGLTIMICLSNIIFSVKIIHNDKYIRNITKKELNKYGLKRFTFKKNYKQINAIKQKILDDYKDVYQWIEIIPNGMSYTVRIEKKVLTKEKKKIHTVI